MVSILLHLLQTSISGYQSISKMEYCYKTRIAVTRDFCQDMEAGVRYSCLRDVFIVDSVRKDNGGLERVVTDFHGTLKKRYKLTVLPNDVYNTKTFEKCDQNDPDGISGDEVQMRFKKLVSELYNANLIPMVYKLLANSQIFFRRYDETELVRSIDLCLWVHLCPRTPLLKQRKFLNI